MSAKKCSVEKKEYEGYESLVMSNEDIQISIVPELGGKILSIIDLNTGREWLWRNPHLPLLPIKFGDSFIEKNDTGGLDECFPAISSGVFPVAPWQGITIPDHGEIWCQPWETEIVEASNKKIVILMKCNGVRFPYLFERKLTMSVNNPNILLEYQVTNYSIFDMPFVWSIHPLINIEEGMQLKLPFGVDNVRLDSDVNGFIGEVGSVKNWPIEKTNANEEIDFSVVPSKNLGEAFKFYTFPKNKTEAVETGIIDPSGNHSLMFRFHQDEITHIGLWMNYGAWSGSGSAPYFNLGIEPCIGGTDSLENAIDMNEYGLLPAKEIINWNLEIIIK